MIKGAHQQLTQHFNSDEFDCPCDECKETLIDTMLIARLEKLRQNLGSKLTITSGYRCANYQNQLKLRGYDTAKGISQHELGKAADITNGVMTGMELADEAAKAGFKAIGIGKHWIHVDLRGSEDGKIRRWTYST